MILGLAGFHDSRSAVKLTEERLERQLFNESPDIFVLVVEAPADAAERLYGYALWYPMYASWEGDFGIHLEDLYVRPESRGSGSGSALLRSLGQVAKDHDYNYISWSVIESNASGIDFYLRHGAKPMKGWQNYVLDEQAIAALTT